MSRTCTRAVLAVLLAASLGLQALPVQASYDSPRELPEPTREQLDRSVGSWDTRGSIRVWDAGRSVKAVEQVATKAGETTISLATDILFTPDSSKLPAAAGARLGALANKIPKGATVEVNGHTDSVKSTVGNMRLSTDRANAVAAVLKAERKDLTLEVKGLAATVPAVREDPKDPSTFAANRRVEIIYTH
ncbi:OmpA family protein [Paeniglutamicibacter psychrophenolicus]|uniref:OmpA family protein n=1 Tax=Paeniglutamicibacter psychrophenolicus TaxID=257454 RepID=UPI002787B922|nr:OmpA family protein [Paeniglutamicibacter psychrophenolicus]MDQ0093241.1 outer membrane protein OmpA-like peptidoglycan-associated protein [Paeniglutamicibacter psychrophenolicus]